MPIDRFDEGVNVGADEYCFDEFDEGLQTPSVTSSFDILSEGESLGDGSVVFDRMGMMETAVAMLEQVKKVLPRPLSS
jgi:hypothetical protein